MPFRCPEFVSVIGVLKNELCYNLAFYQGKLVSDDPVWKVKQLISSESIFPGVTEDKILKFDFSYNDNEMWKVVFT